MLKRRSVVGEVLHDGRAAFDSILKTNSVKTEGKVFRVTIILHLA